MSSILLTTKRRARGALTTRLLALLAGAQLAACEWLMGGIPPKEELDGSLGPADDGSAGAHEATADGGHPAGASGDGGTYAARDAGAGADGGREPTAADSGATVSVPGASDDAATAPPNSDAGPADAGSDEDAGTSTANDAGAEPPCTSPMPWYPDQDEDGYGRQATPTLSCSKPGAKWAGQPGDCNDGNAAVHPGQTAYFGMSYHTSDGADSYDYDCSGKEEGSDGQKAVAQDACAMLLNLAGCADGSGYLPTTRSGADVNAWCGSTTEQDCTAGLLGALVCVADPKTVSDPYGCR